MAPKFQIESYGARDGDTLLPIILPIYAEVYAEYPYFEDAAEAADFSEQYVNYTKESAFQLELARGAEREPIGFALGCSLRPDTDWWSGLLDPVSPDTVLEYKGRTFAIIELAVKPGHRRQGVGRALHHRLLRNRKEERVTLLSRPEAIAAQAAYRQWGYHIVGELRPSKDAPIYLARLRSLPLCEDSSE